MEWKQSHKTFGLINVLRSVAMTLAFCLVVSSVLLIIPGSTASAVPVPGETGYVSMHKYAATTDIDEVYKITLTMDVTVKELHPPSLITFVLDGTASMSAYDVDGTSTRRDDAVRQAMAKALDTLFDPTHNPNREHTYINVIMFGSYNSKAISLTEWATRNNTGITEDGGPYSSSYCKYPGILYNNVESYYIDNTLRASIHGSSNQYGGVAFIPLVDPTSGKMNPYLAGLFNIPANVDSSQMSIYSAVNSWYYYGKTSGLNQFPISNAGTYIGPGMKMAYDDLSDAIMNINSLSSYTYSTEEQALMNKSVLVMADGDETAQPTSDTLGITQSWVAALKAPTSSTIPTYYNNKSVIVAATATSYDCNQSTTTYPSLTVSGSNTTASFSTLDTTTKGLGADVWSMVIGTSGQDATNEPVWVTNYPSLSTTIAKTMSSLVIPLNSSIIAAFQTNDATGPTTSWYNNYFNQYKNIMPFDNSISNRYLRATTVNAATSFFDAFATASTVKAGEIQNCSVVDVIGNQFELCQYPGKPLFETTSSNPAANIGSNTVTASGRTILWNIGDITESCTVTLVYYIKASSGYQEGVYYKTNEYATATYTLNTLDNNYQPTTEDVTLNFPMPYARISDGTVENSEENTSDSAQMQEGAPEETPSGIALFGIAYGDNTQPYTASITPTSEIKEEVLEEGEVKMEVLEEDSALIRIPNTKTATSIIVVALLLSVSSAVYIIIKKHFYEN